VAEIDFDDAGRRRQLVQLGMSEPDPDGSPQDPDRGGGGTALPDFIFQRERRADPVGMGQPVGDQRGLERDHRPASGDGIGDLVGADVRSRHGLAPVRVASSN